MRVLGILRLFEWKLWRGEKERRKNHPCKIAGMESCLECSQNHIFEKLRHAVSYVWKNTNCVFPPFGNEHFYSRKIRDILRLLFTRYVDSLILDPFFTFTWDRKKKKKKEKRIKNFGCPIWSHAISWTSFRKISGKLFRSGKVLCDNWWSFPIF